LAPGYYIGCDDIKATRRLLIHAGTESFPLGNGVEAVTITDAIKALQMVRAYLERSEPTNPAQLLLRRAERLIDKSFLQLVRDLAPDALSEVARIMGVDPDSIESIDRG